MREIKKELSDRHEVLRKILSLAYQNRPKKFYMFRQGYRSERRGNRRRQAEEQLAGHSSERGQPNTSCYCVGVMIHKARLVSVLKNGPTNAHCVILTYKCEAKWCQKHPWACYGERSWQHPGSARVFSLSQGASCQH